MSRALVPVLFAGLLLGSTATAALLEFQIPEKVVMERESTVFSRATVTPISEGMGDALGTCLQSVMMDGVGGRAVTSVRLLSDGEPTDNDLAQLQQLARDLSRVRLRKVLDGDDKIFVSVRGRTVVNDDLSNGVFEAMDPDRVLSRMPADTDLEFEITVGTGRGQHDSVDFDDPTIAGVDAWFGPVEAVDFEVEHLDGYEQLVLDITTDGTARPVDVLQESAAALKRHVDGLADARIVHVKAP